MFEVRCPMKITSASGKIHYFTYEIDPTTMEYYSGVRASDIPAFCGRYSLLNPAFLFQSHGDTEDVSGHTYGKVNVSHALAPFFI